VIQTKNIRAALVPDDMDVGATKKCEYLACGFFPVVKDFGNIRRDPIPERPTAMPSG
jgi:hypothetical protein